MELEIPDVTDSVIISSTEIPDLENQIVPVATAVFEEIPPLNRDIEYNINLQYYYSQFQMNLIYSRTLILCAGLLSLVIVSCIVLYINM
tara:strand:+ start:1388 stop:1654 length:267 start_codon:yes stop_codon:yes gene_type:complete